jgi:hypothetical protein
MSRYRVYALIHGQTLPIGKIDDCEIRQMDFDEQSRRNFSPIKYEFPKKEEYETYVTSVPFVDPVKMYSKYVIVHDIEEHDYKGALGGAIKKFDKVCSSLFISGVRDIHLKHNLYSGEPYLYQINKVYLIDDKDQECEVELDLKSGHIYLPNRPERNEWLNKDTEDFLNKIYNFKDPVFKKALKYLYSSALGHYKLNSHEKIALDHFKSVELIVNSLSSKDKFKDRVDEAGPKLGLSDEEVQKIKRYWDDRSNGDIAHSTHRDTTAFYPNQFPEPKGMEYNWSFADSLARKILLKYFDLRNRFFIIDIEEPFDQARNNTLGIMKGNGECNHLFFETHTKQKQMLLNEVRNKLIEVFGLDKKDFEIEFYQSKAHVSVLLKEGKELNLNKVTSARMRRF